MGNSIVVHLGNVHADKTMKGAVVHLSDVMSFRVEEGVGLGESPFQPFNESKMVTHQQKGTWLQLPYYALLCLISSIRHDKAVVTRFLFADALHFELAAPLLPI